MFFSAKHHSRLESLTAFWVQILILLALALQVITGPLYIFTEGEANNVLLSAPNQRWLRLSLAKVQGVAIFHLTGVAYNIDDHTDLGRVMMTDELNEITNSIDLKKFKIPEAAGAGR